MSRRTSKRADAKKEKYTYLSPQNRAKENARSVREGGERKVTVPQDKKKSGGSSKKKNKK